MGLVCKICSLICIDFWSWYNKLLNLLDFVNGLLNQYINGLLLNFDFQIFV